MLSSLLPMNIQGHKIQIQRTAHFFTSGHLDQQVSVIWLVCHGYGQTADHFLKKFVSLPSDHFVVAPEGLNSFYWHGEDRRPVASWMTSRNREDEIRDYLAYLDAVLTTIKNAAPGAKLVVFGFSQGCATAARFAHATSTSVFDLVLWAGDFPRDIDYSKGAVNRIWHVVGDEDYYITPTRYEIEQQFVREQHLPVTYITFEGPHRIDDEVFAELVQKMEF